MSATTITQASIFISELLEMMENVYWETNSVDVKDQCFNVIRLLQNEVTELTKISVQDHHYAYEVIVCKPSLMHEAFSDLEETLSGEVLRTNTRQQLEPLLAQAHTLFS